MELLTTHDDFLIVTAYRWAILFAFVFKSDFQTIVASFSYHVGVP